MKNFMIGVIMWSVLCGIFWLFWSFINMSLDFTQWGGFSRFCYAAGALITLLNAISEDW